MTQKFYVGTTAVRFTTTRTGKVVPFVTEENRYWDEPDHPNVDDGLASFDDIEDALVYLRALQVRLDEQVNDASPVSDGAEFIQFRATLYS